MNIEEQSTILLKYAKRFEFAVSTQTVSAVRAPKELSDAPSTVKLCPAEIVQAILYKMDALEKENKELKKDFLWSIENSGQLNFIRGVKREFLEKYFPYKIKELPYYAGGDLIGEENCKKLVKWGP